MLSESSEIFHFYNERIAIDMSDGKTELWQGVVSIISSFISSKHLKLINNNKKVILPFIDEVLLKSTINGLSMSEVRATLLELVISYSTIITFSGRSSSK